MTKSSYAPHGDYPGGSRSTHRRDTPYGRPVTGRRGDFSERDAPYDPSYNTVSTFGNVPGSNGGPARDRPREPSNSDDRVGYSRGGPHGFHGGPSFQTDPYGSFADPYEPSGYGSGPSYGGAGQSQGGPVYGGGGPPAGYSQSTSHQEYNPAPYYGAPSSVSTYGASRETAYQSTPSANYYMSATSQNISSGYQGTASSSYQQLNSYTDSGHPFRGAVPEYNSSARSYPGGAPSSSGPNFLGSGNQSYPTGGDYMNRRYINPADTGYGTYSAPSNTNHVASATDYGSGSYPCTTSSNYPGTVTAGYSGPAASNYSATSGYPQPGNLGSSYGLPSSLPPQTTSSSTFYTPSSAPPSKPREKSSFRPF